MFGVATAKVVARERLEMLPRRWRHVQGVGQLAEDVAGISRLADEVVAAAWLHDVGYSPDLVQSSLHGLDGARFLVDLGAAHRVVSLVGHHTGAVFEAEERGLHRELATIPAPTQEDLDALTLLDLCISPDGLPTHPTKRVAEILHRYAEGDPVHRAVSRSAPSLLESTYRARIALGLADEWPLQAGQSVS